MEKVLDMRFRQRLGTLQDAMEIRVHEVHYDVELVVFDIGEEIVNRDDLADRIEYKTSRWKCSGWWIGLEPFKKRAIIDLDPIAFFG